MKQLVIGSHYVRDNTPMDIWVLYEIDASSNSVRLHRVSRTSDHWAGSISQFEKMFDLVTE
jgi:hypothetical protein